MLGGSEPIAARLATGEFEQDSIALYGRGWSITFKPFGPVVYLPVR